MKRKALKITENTLFVYKQSRAAGNRSDTDPTTTMITTTAGTSGIFNSSQKN